MGLWEWGKWAKFSQTVQRRCCLAMKWLMGLQLGGGEALRAVGCSSLDNPALAAPSDPPTHQMLLLLSLPQSSRASTMSHSARPAPLGSCAQANQPTDPLLPSPLPKGNIHAIRVTGPGHGLPPPLIPLASQDLCLGENSERGCGTGVYTEPQSLAKVCLFMGAIKHKHVGTVWSLQANPGMAALWIWASWAPSPCPHLPPAPTVTPLSEDCCLTLCAPGAKCFNLAVTRSLL